MYDGLFFFQANSAIFIGIRRPEDDNSSDSFYWITTGEPLSYTDWLPSKPTSHTDRQCVYIIEDRGIIGWTNWNCNFHYYILCKL